MSAITGIVAGIAAAAGAVALYKFASRRADAIRKAIDDAFDPSRAAPAQEPVLDFERDPATGVFRAK